MAPATAHSTSSLLDQLPAEHLRLVEDAARRLPARTEEVLAAPTHRALGRVVRDATLLLCLGSPSARAGAGPSHGAMPPARPLVEAARSALRALGTLQGPSGTFRGGDNVDSPPDTAFTVNDLAWARVRLGQLPTSARTAPELAGTLDDLLGAVAPALVHGGVHTPNHRWEIASALSRLWEAGGAEQTRERALEWLAEGVDLQADGLFSERSANYAAHVSVPSLLAMGRILELPALIEAADRGTRTQAELTDADGRVETLASRRQDQFELFDGGALHPWFRSHAARTGDPLSSRAVQRTSALADADAVLTLLAHAMEEPAALDPLPGPAPSATAEGPEIVELGSSGLVRIDHGSSRAVLFGGTDTAAIGRIASGTSSRPVFARLAGRSIGVREVRLSRDFFSLGPLRPGPPRRTAGPDGAGGCSYRLEEQVEAEYFHPLAPVHRDPQGDYPLGFTGRFAAAMDFPHRPVDRVRLSTTLRADLAPGRLDLHFSIDGPETPLCLLLALDGGSLSPALRRDEQGRHVLEPSHEGTTTDDLPRAAHCTLEGHGEALEISAAGALGGRAFYAPGEAYTFLGATDEPSGEVLLIPALSSTPLTLSLRLGVLGELGSR